MSAEVKSSSSSLDEKHDLEASHHPVDSKSRSRSRLVLDFDFGVEAPLALDYAW